MVNSHGFECLVEAVVEQAARDYFDLKAGFVKPVKYNTVRGLERFFRSGYFHGMTQLDPDYLMKKLKEEAARMVLEYTVAKEKGSHNYYVHRVGDEKTRLTEFYATKKKALHKAAEMQNTEYVTYMRIRRREGLK